MKHQQKPVPGTHPAVYPGTRAYRVFLLAYGQDRAARRRIVSLATEVAAVEARLQRIEQDRNKFWERYVCAVCSEQPAGDYMVTDAVWAAAGFGPRQFACFACFEARLGRAAQLADFPDVPCNAAIRALLGRS